MRRLKELFEIPYERPGFAAARDGHSSTHPRRRETNHRDASSERQSPKRPRASPRSSNAPGLREAATSPGANEMMAATHAKHVVRPAATSLGGRRPAARGAVARRTPSTRQVRSPAGAAARRAREPRPRPWPRGALAARPTTFSGGERERALGFFVFSALNVHTGIGRNRGCHPTTEERFFPFLFLSRRRKEAIFSPFFQPARVTRDPR